MQISAQRYNNFCTYANKKCLQYCFFQKIVVFLHPKMQLPDLI